jgi:hypothetical protein
MFRLPMPLTSKFPVCRPQSDDAKSAVVIDNSLGFNGYLPATDAFVPEAFSGGLHEPNKSKDSRLQGPRTCGSPIGRPVSVMLSATGHSGLVKTCGEKGGGIPGTSMNAGVIESTVLLAKNLTVCPRVAGLTSLAFGGLVVWCSKTLAICPRLVVEPEPVRTLSVLDIAGGDVSGEGLIAIAPKSCSNLRGAGGRHGVSTGSSISASRNSIPT